MQWKKRRTNSVFMNNDGLITCMLVVLQITPLIESINYIDFTCEIYKIDASKRFNFLKYLNIYEILIKFL